MERKETLLYSIGVVSLGTGKLQEKAIKSRVLAACAAFVAVLLCWLAPFESSEAEILKARTGLHADKTRFVLELSEKPDYSFDKNPEDGQVVIELKNIGVPKGRAVPSLPVGLVKHTMFISKGGQSSQVVLFLSKPAKVKNAFVIPGENGKAHRLVVDLLPTP